MLKYLGNSEYETYLENGTKIKLSCTDLVNIVKDVKEVARENNHEDSDKLHEETVCKYCENNE